MKKLAVVAVALISFATGCGASRATLTKTGICPGTEKHAQNVEVLLDAAPTQPFEVVAELTADTLESPRSVKLMQEEAARQGLDGIYWIECASGRGACKAKGFVYASHASRETARAGVAAR
jgi:hypothetical protein